MIPAEAKKKENIAEYIIHMYQTEDLILTYNFNLNDILEYVIKHMTTDLQEIKALLLWYADIIDRMQQEQVHQTKAKLSSTQYYVQALTELHNKLLKSEPVYQQLYRKAEVQIDKQIKLAEGTIHNPIQLCINGVYGMLLLKLNGKTLAEEQKSMVENFGAILAYLSQIYHRNNAALL